MISSRLTLLLAVLPLFVLDGCAEAGAESFTTGGIRYAEESATEWKLPGALRELSGFATDDRGRLFGHDDEQAFIHQIDYAAGGILKSFAFGNPPVRGDFEGITVIAGEFALTTSNGDLYLGAEGDDGERVGYRVIKTGLGRQCEIEGVEYVAEEQLLYFLCKTARRPEFADRLTLLAWSVERQAEVPARRLQIDLALFDDLPGKGKLQPSGLARSPATGDFVVAAASHRALITLSATGEGVGAIRLAKSGSLPQIEAIAFAPDGTLMIGSEGQKDRGRMRVYRATD